MFCNHRRYYVSPAVTGNTTGAAVVTVRVTFIVAGVPVAGEAPVNVMVPV